MSDFFGMSISSNDSRIQSKLRLLANKGDLLGTELMDALGKLTAEYAEGPIFNSEGGVIGARWQPLSTKYMNWKNKNTNQSSLLVFSGKMKDSFAWTAHSDYVEVGNNAPYFAYHQSSEPRTKMPRRQMIGFDETLKNQIKTKMRSDITRKLATV